LNGCIVRKKDEFYQGFQFQEYGDSDIRNAFISASRLNLDTLVVDLDIAPAAAVLLALHTYRVQRPGTRIIALAPGRRPGDATVSRIIAMGIYDIVAPDDAEAVIPELESAVRNPAATYSQAARWLQLEQPFNSSKEHSNKDSPGKSTVPEVKTEVLIQQRPLGLTTIAVAGAGPGAGVSHLCLSIASYLAGSGNHTVLAEYPIGEKKTGVESQYGYLPGARYDKTKTKYGIEINTACLHGFNIFLDARSFRLIEYVFPVIAQNSYDYLVLDLGELSPDSPEKIAEMDRAALAILTVNAAPYRIERFLPFVDKQEISVFAPNLPRWKIALNLASDKEIRWFSDNFSQQVGEVYPIPFMADILEQPAGIREILQPVLPTNTNTTAENKLFSRLRAILKR